MDGPLSESCRTLSHVWIRADEVPRLADSESLMTVACLLPLSASRPTKLHQMTAEVWLAEGLDALILARCSPLSPKTNRVLRHPAQQLLFANASLCPDGRSASGATIRSLYCANKMHARQMFVFSLKTFTLLCPDTSPPHTWYPHRFTSCTLTQRFCFSDYSTVHFKYSFHTFSAMLLERLSFYCHSVLFSCGRRPGCHSDGVIATGIGYVWKTDCEM